MQLSDLPIDPRISEIFARQGITELYPPQADALPRVLEGKNVVMSVPTASGKSLVAYIGILRAVLAGRKAIYIVPLRALASEKYEELKQFGELGVTVALSIGDFDSSARYLQQYDIVVATSERADSLFRHRSQWLQDISVVVADEVHLLTDASRGPTLEVTLSRFRTMKTSIQIIALSATIQNARELADWLTAELVESNWRPVPLKQGACHDHCIVHTDFSVTKLPTNGDLISSLVLETINNDGQVLIFVNTRKNAEALAKRLMLPLSEILDPASTLALETAAAKLEAAHREETTIGRTLRECLRRGCAFHHAGLASTHRRVIEEEFKSHALKCIVATPTLAAGINLPARRVLIRNLHRFESETGMARIPILEIQQMCGRAGRPKYDTEGEALIITPSEDRAKQAIENYFFAEPEPIESKLGNESMLRVHILASIATGFARTMEEVKEFLNETFYAHTAELWTIEAILGHVIEFLNENGFIEVMEDGRFFTTDLGRRTSQLYIDPMTALRIKTAFSRPMPAVGTPPTLALLHVISGTTDMVGLYLRKGDEAWLTEILDTYRNDLLLPVPDPEDPEDHGQFEWFLSDLKTALLVEYWINEITEDRICREFNVGPGDIHSKVDIAEWLLYAARELCKILGLPYVRELDELNLRVRNGIKRELISLVQLKGIGRVRARALFTSGYKTRLDLVHAPLETLAMIPMIGLKTARSIHEQLHVAEEFISDRELKDAPIDGFEEVIITPDDLSEHPTDSALASASTSTSTSTSALTSAPTRTPTSELAENNENGSGNGTEPEGEPPSVKKRQRSLWDF